VEQSNAFRGFATGALFGGTGGCNTSANYQGVGEVRLMAGAGQRLTIEQFLVALYGSRAGNAAVQVYDLATGLSVFSGRAYFNSSSGFGYAMPNVSSTVGLAIQFGITTTSTSWVDDSRGEIGINMLRYSRVSVVPEPMGLSLAATLLGVIVVFARRRQPE
jgi:hypothetical protein